MQAPRPQIAVSPLDEAIPEYGESTEPDSLPVHEYCDGCEQEIEPEYAPKALCYAVKIGPIAQRFYLCKSCIKQFCPPSND